MIFGITMALAFFHYGEVHFWHKQVIFWSTVVLVMFFMFKSAKPKA
jgi:Ca2+/Na+ antiporter